MRIEPTPYITEVIASSWMIAKGEPNACEWLTPQMTWTWDIFEAARFELWERWKVEAWLDAVTQPSEQETQS